MTKINENDFKVLCVGKQKGTLGKMQVYKITKVSVVLFQNMRMFRYDKQVGDRKGDRMSAYVSFVKFKLKLTCKVYSICGQSLLTYIKHD